MRIPKPIQNLIEAFERLPGIGPKTAARLTFYLLHVPQRELDRLSEAALNLKKKTVLCSVCFNVSETDPCPICNDDNRSRTQVCVVENPLDVLAIEKSGSYKGLYHVLHGAIDPLNNIGPDELRIKELLKRIKSLTISHPEPEQSSVQGSPKPSSALVYGHQPLAIEIILATNPNMEGEATAMYIANQIREVKSLRITRIGRGLPVGGDLEYADEATLTRALEGRREY